MITCGWCRDEVDETAWACPSCGNDPHAAPPRPPDTIAVGKPGAAERPRESIDGTERTEPDPPHTALAPEPAGTCTEPDCGGPIIGDPRVCALCGKPAPALTITATPTLAAQFPWGTQLIPAGGLELGRGVGPDDLQQRMAAYQNISRHHAGVARAATSWVLTDLDSTNGTWVDGTRIPGRVPQPVGPGTRVRLGAHLEFTLVDGGT